MGIELTNFCTYASASTSRAKGVTQSAAGGSRLLSLAATREGYNMLSQPVKFIASITIPWILYLVA